MKEPIKNLFQALDLLKSVAETMTLELGKEQELLKKLEHDVEMLKNKTS
jgi:hypothetical protein